MVCQILDHHLNLIKIPYQVKHEVHTNIMDVDTANQTIGLKPTSLIDVQLCEMKLFDTISPSQMAEYQKRDTHLSYVYEHVAGNSKPKVSEIHHIRSKPIRRLLLQFDQLSLIWGVLHHCTFQDNDEIQQLILPQCLHNQVLKSLHDDNGHQSLQHNIDLLQPKVYWPSMFVDTNCWLAQCEWCQIAKGDYTEPKTLQGSLVANQPLELLCIDFTKADITKGGKGNILVLTDAFSKYSQAFVTNNQKSLTVAKYLLKNGSLFLGYLQGSTVINVGPLITRSFQISARCMALGRALSCHTICVVIHSANSSIEPSLD